jgi:integrase
MEEKSLMTNVLTHTRCLNAKPQPKEFNLSDPLSTGLALRVKPTGGKHWLFNYTRPFTKKRTNISIGQFPAVSLQDARLAAADYRTQLSNGIDPKLERDSLKQQNLEQQQQTFKVVSAQWLALKQHEVSPAYLGKIRIGMDKHLLPSLGHVPLSGITAPMVIHAMQPLADKSALVTIGKVCRWLNEMMSYAVNCGVIHHNPCAGVKAAFRKPKRKPMPTITPEELPGLLQSILPKTNIRQATKNLFMFQLHTMVRPAEAAGARWEEIDLEAGTWTIPKERMKKNREHIVPLSKQVLEILADMHPVSGQMEHIFPNLRTPSLPANSQSVNMMLKRHGYHGRLVSHGLRALASTTLNEKEFNHDVIEAALAHTDQNQIRQAYNRAQYIQQREKLMTWWSQHIDDCEIGALEKSIKGLKLVQADG